MALVTFQVLDGLERGLVFDDLPTPVTIGREDDNHIRLNDERVSRFHAKIQEDGGHFILTDLQSTNGTRVNGHPVQVHVLQVGDQVLIGRCLLLYGSREQLHKRLEELRSRSPEGAGAIQNPVVGDLPWHPAGGADSIAQAGVDDIDGPGDLFPVAPPETPQGLSPLQLAQVSDLVAYAHSNLLRILLAARSCSDPKEMPDDWMAVPTDVWHVMQQLEVHLAQCLRKISDP